MPLKNTGFREDFLLEIIREICKERSCVGSNQRNCANQKKHYEQNNQTVFYHALPIFI